MSVDEIVAGVWDDSFVDQHKLGIPFYSEISYMLVSMECLSGAAYTHAVEAAGLTTRPRLSLGRLDTIYSDWRIGICSEKAQMWVDRSFALDYTLKSIEKLLDGQSRYSARCARRTMKTASYRLLGRMLELIAGSPIDGSPTDAQVVKEKIERAMNDGFSGLLNAMAHNIDSLVPYLPTTEANVLRREHDRWRNSTAWKLINSAEVCDP
jgi:hypothetical protein